MKLTRFSKRIIVVACSIAMVVAGLVFSPAQDAKAAEPDWSTISYLGDGAGGGAYANKYKFYAENGTTAINIQHPPFATEDSIYVGFPAAGIQCSLAGYDVQGAGVCLHLSNFTNKVTEFTVSWAGGSTTCYVYYEDGAEGPTTTVDPSAPTTTTGETTTTVAPVPGAPVGLVAQLLNNDTVVYVAHGPASGTVTGYHYYLDGVLDSRFFNGCNIPVTDFTPGQTYTVDVKAYNASGEGPAATATFTIPNPQPENYMDVTPYKSTTPYTYPTKEGKIFAGWFSDEELTTPYTATTGYAYAKFIDEKVLTVQFQTANDGSAVRFVSTIDNCLDYQSVGFKFTGTYGNAAITEKTKTVNSVFEKISGGGQEYIPSTAFNNDDSAYFFTYTVRGMTDAATASTWNVTPFYVTPDGTTVTGTANTYPVS